MVAKFYNRIIYIIYNCSKRYLIEHNCLVDKSKIDYVFWGGL